MNYCYFGNTTLKTGKLLEQLEAQLILFKELFENTNDEDVWTNNSDLQYRYQELLIQHNLLKTSDSSTGSKNARAKSAPLEDYGLVNRKEKTVTDLGEELIRLLNAEKFRDNNNFLQIDLISLFFFKATLNSVKNSDNIEGVFKKYLDVFKSFNGTVEKEKFRLLPTMCNFDSVDDFINKLNDSSFTTLSFLSELLYKDEKLQERREAFFTDVQKDDFTNPEYFKTSKGISAAHIVIEMYKIFVSVRDKSYSKETVRDLFKTKVNGNTNYYKSLYLSNLFGSKIAITSDNALKNYKKLISFIREGSDADFNNNFFDLIYSSRMLNNLEDYYQLNRYYLYLTGILDFKTDEVCVSETVNIILQHSKYEDIIKNIAKEKVSVDSLDYLIEDEEIKAGLSKLGISSTQDIKDYQYNKNRQKLQKLLDNDFAKENIINKILPLFKSRKDKDLNRLVSEYANVPTIFEYIIAISWYYIDNKNVDHILNAGLSLDSNMLPKSHAVGGSSDFEIKYLDHTLMIEVTLTKSSNQRRAEMESVSRHLGDILLEMKEEDRRKKTYGIFISTHLDKNVLNDFRLRQLSYWENKDDFIKGMNILPLDTDDLISLLGSNKSYDELRADFYDLIDNEEDRGSLWYKNSVRPYMSSLNE